MKTRRVKLFGLISPQSRKRTPWRGGSCIRSEVLSLALCPLGLQSRFEDKLLGISVGMCFCELQC